MSRAERWAYWLSYRLTVIVIYGSAVAIVAVMLWLALGCPSI